MSESIQFCYCDFANEEHCTQLARLINHYITDPMGGGTPLSPLQQLRMIDGLANHPASFILFILVDENIIGLASCFINFSTFKAKPYINIHDLIIDDTCRKKGYGTMLLDEIERIAKERKYCKITLEVRNDNLNAQKTYTNAGFRDVDPPMLFWTKTL